MDNIDKASWAVLIIGLLFLLCHGFSTLGPVVTLLIFIAVGVFQILIALAKHPHDSRQP